jgi:hypothetical protein
MFDRTYFSSREMSLVDQNYPLLNQYLRGRPDQNGNNNAAQESEE